ncbi:GntR family transcriptional regulator [Mesorhizobium sp.]|uniref:GntR family transcriptional regulator n=1 Tax=Mesorhizobium sp. TaxID=1871066 RepID=UPI000FE70F93|nr:GntR family transcriptional regulator [Mesorhizobium sp.]RWC61807.1 MAG: GntR family transcriptional regulator [Mesorhizobium sp.]RWC66415.1 MAG: GntR family transcriptional regulator [Mesorhizobium sp.]
MTKALDEIAKRYSLRQEATAQTIVSVLREAVAFGAFEPGDRLHQEELAEAFGVSRVPVREALSQLVAEGLAVHLPNKGIRVAPASIDEFNDITELRLVLEPIALKKSAPHLTEADLVEAEKMLKRVRRHWKTAEGAALHWEFHQKLYSKAQRPRLIAQIKSLQLSISRYIHKEWLEVGLVDGWDADHQDIVDALRAGKPDYAAQLVADQIEVAAARVRQRLTITDPT